MLVFELFVSKHFYEYFFLILMYVFVNLKSLNPDFGFKTFRDFFKSKGFFHEKKLNRKKQMLFWKLFFLLISAQAWVRAKPPQRGAPAEPRQCKAWALPPRNADQNVFIYQGNEVEQILQTFLDHKSKIVLKLYNLIKFLNVLRRRKIRCNSIHLHEEQRLNA